jgi:hypothetical protein
VHRKTWDAALAHAQDDAAKLAEADSPNGCPCLYATPCHPDCTCVKGHSSRGCQRCARYGSIEQRRARAARIVEGEGKLAEAVRLAKKAQTVQFKEWLGVAGELINLLASEPSGVGAGEGKAGET